MAHLAQPFDFGPSFQAGATPRDFRIQRSDFTITPSRERSLTEPEGYHLIVVRKGNALGEFTPQEHNFLIERAIPDGFRDPQVSSLCLGQNFGTLRKNPHPHLHIVQCRVDPARLPDQLQEPRDTHQISGLISARKINQECRTLGDLIVAAQEIHAHVQDELARYGGEGSRIVLRCDRAADGPFNLYGYTYTGALQHSSLPPLTSARKPGV